MYLKAPNTVQSMPWTLCALDLQQRIEGRPLPPSPLAVLRAGGPRHAAIAVRKLQTDGRVAVAAGTEKPENVVLSISRHTVQTHILRWIFQSNFIWLIPLAYQAAQDEVSCP